MRRTCRKCGKVKNVGSFYGLKHTCIKCIDKEAALNASIIERRGREFEKRAKEDEMFYPRACKRCESCKQNRSELRYRNRHVWVCIRCEEKIKEKRTDTMNRGMVNCCGCGAEKHPSEIQHSISWWGGNADYEGRWYGMHLHQYMWHQVPYCNGCHQRDIDDLRERELKAERHAAEVKALMIKQKEELHPDYIRKLLRSQGLTYAQIDSMPDMVEITRLHLKTKQELKNLKL